MVAIASSAFDGPTDAAQETFIHLHALLPLLQRSRLFARLLPVLPVIHIPFSLAQIWSRSGNLRSTLMQTGHSLYALAWSPDSESVVVGDGRDLAVKGVQVRECREGLRE